MKQECGRIVRSLAVVMSLVALNLLGTSASWAQQKSLKEQLVGAWSLVSHESTRRDGTKHHAFGPDASGILILDASGRYAIVFGRSDRPHLSTTAHSRMPAEELAEAARAFAANSGTWSVNEADHTLTRKYERALIPNTEKREWKNSITLSENELKLEVVSVNGLKIEQVFHRVKPIETAGR